MNTKLRKFQVRECRPGEWDVVWHNDYKGTIHGSADTFTNYEKVVELADILEKGNVYAGFWPIVGLCN